MGIRINAWHSEKRNSLLGVEKERVLVSCKSHKWQQLCPRLSWPFTGVVWRYNHFLVAHIILSAFDIPDAVFYPVRRGYFQFQYSIEA